MVGGGSAMRGVNAICARMPRSRSMPDAIPGWSDLLLPAGYFLDYIGRADRSFGASLQQALGIDYKSGRQDRYLAVAGQWSWP